MDYQSFQPGGQNQNQNQNQNQMPFSPVPEIPKPQNLSDRLRPYRWHIAISGGVIIALLFGAYSYLKYTNEKLSQEVVPTFTPRADVTAGWKTYTNTQYGFELKLPVLLQLLTSNNSGTVIVSGKIYNTIQLVNGLSPSVKIIKNLNDSSVDPYGDSGSLSQLTIVDVAWNMFYNPKGGRPECDSSLFQTKIPNSQDVISISMLDESHCPGDPAQMPSVIYLKQILSTFKFTQ